MCWGQGRFLFEVIPDIFPYDHLTDLEQSLWVRYAEQRRRNNG